MKIMVSACLLGEHCKYSGGSNYNEELCRLLEGHEIITVCPEVMGGLPTPRPAAEIVNETVINREGRSVDLEFRQGAEMALQLAVREKVDFAVLQSRSPSCGVHQVYDGTFSGTLRQGSGVFASRLMEHDILAVDVQDRQTIQALLYLNQNRKLSGGACRVYRLSSGRKHFMEILKRQDG